MVRRRNLTASFWEKNVSKLFLVMWVHIFRLLLSNFDYCVIETVGMYVLLTASVVTVYAVISNHNGFMLGCVVINTLVQGHGQC